MNEYLVSLVQNPLLLKMVAMAIGLAIVVLASRVVRGSITRYIKISDTRYRLRKLANIGAYLTVILLFVGIFSDSLDNFPVAMGVAGAGIAFALQEVIASFAGWFGITFAGFYKPGDRVQLGGIKGDVIDVGFLRTTLMEVGEWVNADLYSGRVVRVANSFVFKEPVFNYSGEFPFLWDEITIPVKYGSDHKLARKLLSGAASETIGDYSERAAETWKSFSKQFLLEDAAFEPSVTLIATDNWLEFTVRYVVEFKFRRVTKDKLFSKIIEEFDTTGGKVSFASNTLQLVDTGTIGVRLENPQK